MASNETVEELVLEMFEYPKSWGEYNHLDWKALADRIEAAHKREISARKDERLTIVAMYETIIAAKDAKIAELRERIKVATDALDKIYKCIDNRYGVDASMLAKNITADAIAAIRRKEEQ